MMAKDQSTWCINWYTCDTVQVARYHMYQCVCNIDIEVQLKNLEKTELSSTFFFLAMTC